MYITVYIKALRGDGCDCRPIMSCSGNDGGGIGGCNSIIPFVRLQKPCFTLLKGFKSMPKQNDLSVSTL